MMRALLALAGALTLMAQPASAVDDGLIVKTSQGLARGVALDGGVRRFEGLPYAAPPVGDLRWRAPRPAKTWIGVRNADRPGPRCLQSSRLGDIDPRNPRMGEDCLYLNIWTASKPGDKRPVMVWIHGGGHTVGSSTEPWYAGHALAREGVVYVSLNYRVDVFGFFSHPALGTPSGNWGLMDQIAALQWVRANIAAFGGDPANVTIFGESAGAVSVSALMLAPGARGLFHRAIGQSGSVLYAPASPYAPDPLPRAEAKGQAMAADLGADSAEALRALPAEKVLEASLKRAAEFPGVIVDGAVIPGDPIILFERGAFADVPTLIGWNTDEGSLFALRPGFGSVETFQASVRQRFGVQGEALLKRYPADPSSAFPAFVGDELIGQPGWKWAQTQAATGRAPVYRYLFDHRPPAPELSLLPLAAPGAFHSAEIAYVLGTMETRDWPWTEQDRALSRLMMTYWVNFARTGDPNGPALPDWPRYEPRDATILRLDPQPKAELDPLGERYRSLDEAYRAASGQ